MSVSDKCAINLNLVVLQDLLCSVVFLVVPVVFYDFMFVLHKITNKFFTPTDSSDSAATNFGSKQTKTEPQSPWLYMYKFSTTTDCCPVDSHYSFWLTCIP